MEKSNYMLHKTDIGEYYPLRYLRNMLCFFVLSLPKVKKYPNCPSLSPKNVFFEHEISVIIIIQK